jgi:hypothetical protein
MCLAISNHNRRVVTQTCSRSAPPFRSDPPNQWRRLKSVRHGHCFALRRVQGGEHTVEQGEKSDVSFVSLSAQSRVAPISLKG